jgi:inward rectifier potassium channel
VFAGSDVKPPKPKSVRVQLGGRKFTKIGVRTHDWRDAYHVILALNWVQFFLLIVVVYVSANLIFAAIYQMQPGAVANTTRGFLDYLFFSIETLSTVGYGYMYPVTVYAHIVASVEIFVGLLSVALVTGLMFARFSRPRARILFSKVAVVGRFDGAPTLMIRVANERHNPILEADVSLTLIRLETTSDGEKFRRQHDLRLLRKHSAAFALSWTIMHPITAESPLHGFASEDMKKSDLLIAVSVTGLDEVLEQKVHARGEYTAESILYNRRFVDILVPDEGRTILDLTRFHDTEPMDASAPAASQHPHPHRAATTD